MKPSVLNKPQTSLKTRTAQNANTKSSSSLASANNASLTNLLLKKSRKPMIGVSNVKDEINWNENLKIQYKIKEGEKDIEDLKSKIWLLQKRNMQLSSLYQLYSDIIYGKTSKCELSKETYQNVLKDPVFPFSS